MKKMNAKQIYKWMKNQRGNFTINQLLHEFSESKPEEIAKGLIMYTESKFS